MFVQNCLLPRTRSTIVMAALFRAKMYAVLVFALISAISSPALATVYKQINFEWEYDTTLPELAGYILYQDNQHLHTINDSTSLTIDLSVGLEPGQTTAFTMKAFDINGNESALSAPYSLDVPSAVEGNNFLPTILANHSAMSGDAPLTVEFSAVGSTDFDGTIVSYAWDFGDGDSAQTSTVSHTFVTAATYTVTLTVTDNDGGASVEQWMVTVSGLPPANVPPSASLNLSVSSGQAPLAVEFSPEGSADSDGTIAFYAWDFGDGESALTSSASHVSHTYTIAGTYTVTLTVTDNAGGVSSAQTAVVVSSPPPNVPPTARLSLSPNSGQAPLAVELSATGSTDSDGTIVSYVWDFGDGGSVAAATTNHTYTIAGTYTVTLTVTDNAGGVSSAQSQVVVSVPPSNLAPTAFISVSASSGQAPFTVECSASDSIDSDGTIVSYAWDFGDGGSATTSMANYTYSTAGTYTITLTVTDDSRAVGEAQTTITVLAATTEPIKTHGSSWLGSPTKRSWFWRGR